MDLVAVIVVHPSRVLAGMVLYIGPDVFLPFLSAVAGAVGVLLVFWQRVTGFVARLWRTMFHRHG